MFDISGTIEAECDGELVIFTGKANELWIEMDTINQSAGTIRFEMSKRKAGMINLAKELKRVGCTFRFMSQGKMVAVLGSSAKPGLVSRLLRIPYLEVGQNWNALKMLLR